MSSDEPVIGTGLRIFGILFHAPFLIGGIAMMVLALLGIPDSDGDVMPRWTALVGLVFATAPLLFIGRVYIPERILRRRQEAARVLEAATTAEQAQQGNDTFEYAPRQQTTPRPVAPTDPMRHWRWIRPGLGGVTLLTIFLVSRQWDLLVGVAAGIGVGLVLTVAVAVPYVNTHFRLRRWVRANGYDLQKGPRGPAYTQFEPMRRGGTRSSIISGRARGLPFEAWTHVWTTGGSKQQRTHTRTVLRLPAPRSPGFQLRPERISDRLGDAVRMADVDTESEAFSRAYHVTGDRAFAYAVLHPAMMEALLAMRFPWHLQWRGGSLVIVADDILRPALLQGMLEAGHQFLARLPRHLPSSRAPASRARA